MKNVFTISVKKPCSEKFQDFDQTPSGGFCTSCSKEVIDFTQMSDLELISYFSKKNGKTCGRFKTSQLKTYNTGNATPMNTNFLSKSFGIASFSLLALCAVSNTNAQETASLENINQIEVATRVGKVKIQQNIKGSYLVKGVVLDEENLPLPGANVVLKGSNVGTVTGIDGKFEFPQKVETGDVLVISYLGYISQKYKVPESKLDTLDITITFEAADVELMGAVEVDGVYKTKRNLFQKIGDWFK
ncbi:carboxypeptidase-like regulatory domain-containing protein [Maribacter sp. 2210JD10-5]|uniref:carboxypeptidase-like regulatory domain-containing protein n=1 Tax=Maribacter sp. 2210JD10-5 TaxID=3386272 RepID=UPI0039BD8644